MTFHLVSCNLQILINLITFVRQDPPYNMEYISSMHLLEQISHKVRIINNPQGIRNVQKNFNAKI